jgi:hypothetical protein
MLKVIVLQSDVHKEKWIEFCDNPNRTLGKYCEAFKETIVAIWGKRIDTQNIVLFHLSSQVSDMVALELQSNGVGIY